MGQPRRPASMVPSFLSGDLRIALPSASLIREARDTGRAMSQENIKLVLEAVDAFNRQDRDAFVALASADVEWEDAIFWSETARTYRGRAGASSVVRPGRGALERIHLDVDEITAAADAGVFFSLFITARGKSSGVKAPGLRVWSVCWFADGLFTKRQVFRERDQALEAAGLRE